MCLEEKVGKISASLIDYLTEKENARVYFDITECSVIIEYCDVVLFELTNSELRPTLLDTYAYIIARVIHSHYDLHNALNGKV